MTTRILIDSIGKSHNLETYCLIWLDKSVNISTDNIHAQQLLRESINTVLTFDDDQRCLEYIDHLSDDDRIIMIVSGQFGQTIVPQVSCLRKVVSIYVYCMNKIVNEQWAQHFSKVKGVIVQLDQLIKLIQSDEVRSQHIRLNEPLTINIFKPKLQNYEQSSTGIDGQFIYSHLLIDCLIRMIPTVNDKNDCVYVCKQQYKDNAAELNIIEEFQQKYSSEQAIWWYTRECFLYRLLNKALRIQNIDILFILRFFIRDIEQQLENNKCSIPIRAYRAQQMFNEEIDILKNSIGEFISMNSFLSTSLNRQKALGFYSSTNKTDDTQHVFFEIDADPRLNNIKPFSRISSLSYFPDEEEVLFMIGSIFRLESMQCDDEGVWHIRMTLCSDNDHQVQTLVEYMKNELSTEQTNTLILGHVLRKMGRLNDAERYYRVFLDQFSYDDSNRAHCYHALGLLEHDKGNLESSLIWYNKSLEIFRQILKPNDLNIAVSHNSIAIVYQQKGEYSRALESYEKALSIWKQTFGDDHPCTGICLNNMSNVYRNDKQYAKALECIEKALNIFRKHLPPDHSNLAALHGSLGNIHLCLNHYDQALQSYNFSLEIQKKALPSQHTDIAITLSNIAVVYERINDYHKALHYFRLANDIYRCSMPAMHPQSIQIEQNIKYISSKLK